MTTKDVLIVGAGLAGLTCARQLGQAGVAVTVVDADRAPGGRVQSDRERGYILDRGFQVLFDHYPAARRNLDLAALDLRPFEPGALICPGDGQPVQLLTDPLRDRNLAALLDAALAPALPLGDKLRTLRLALALRESPAAGGAESDPAGDAVAESSLDYLRRRGFSQRAIDSFFRPFFGGIFLDRSLSTSAAAFRYYFRMMASGRTVLPAQGMGAITQQLAAPLGDAANGGRLRLGTQVAALLRDGQAVCGVRLANGSELHASAVVIATDGPAAQALLGDLAGAAAIPSGSLGTTLVYLHGSERLYGGAKLVLNAAADAVVNNVQMLSNVAASYAPAGRHLLSATLIGVPSADSDEQVFRSVRSDLERMFAADRAALAALRSYEPLRIYRIRHAQFPQPPGARLPGVRGAVPGLYYAAEWTESSSIHGAMRSGERCAAAIVSDQQAG